MDLAIHLEREQDGKAKQFGENEFMRRCAQADAQLRTSLGEDKYQQYISNLEERETNADAERWAAIKNWEVEHFRDKNLGGYKCHCAEDQVPCICSVTQKIGWQCGSVGALEMAALLQSQGREANSLLEAAALRVATAEAEQLRLRNERVDHIRGVPSRCEGRLLRDPEHRKSMHIADRLLRSFPGVLMRESEHAMVVYRQLSPTELILSNWDIK